MIPAWVAGYIGIPFEGKGRTREGCDCYGLLRLVELEQFAQMLPEYSDYDPGNQEEEARLIDERLPLIGASRVESPEAGDIVQLRYLGAPSHVGVFVGDGMVLHTAPKKGVVLESLSSVNLASRIVGYFRIR